MSKVITGLAGMAVLCASISAAQAQTSQNINLQANVNKFCTISGSMTPGDLSRTLVVTDGASAFTAPAPINIGTVICNSNAQVQLISLRGALIQGAGPAAANTPAGFQNYMTYSAQISTPVLASVTADASAATISGTGVPTGGAGATPNVTVTITPGANAYSLLPSAALNDYTDTLIVRFTPL
jgi:hypothetical protein